MWHGHFNTRTVNVFIQYNYFDKLQYQIIVFVFIKINNILQKVKMYARELCNTEFFTALQYLMYYQAMWGFSWGKYIYCICNFCVLIQ